MSYGDEDVPREDHVHMLDARAWGEVHKIDFEQPANGVLYGVGFGVTTAEAVDDAGVSQAVVFVFEIPEQDECGIQAGAPETVQLGVMYPIETIDFALRSLLKAKGLDAEQVERIMADIADGAVAAEDNG